MKARVVIIAVLVYVVGACGGATTTTQATTTTTLPPTTGEATTTVATTTTTAAPTTTEAAVPRIVVEGGVKTDGLDTLSVRVGEPVVLEVLADVTDEVHVHGFDLHFDVVAGDVTLVEFTPDATGIFEVELEAASLPILDLEVTP